MYYTKADQVEKAVMEVALTMVEATLKIVEEQRGELSEKEANAFATGVKCSIDAMQFRLLPKLREIVKENPEAFQNLN